MYNSPCILIGNSADSFEEIKCFDRINLALEKKTKHGIQSFLLSLVVKTLNYSATVFVFSDREYTSCDALQICILDSILDISISTSIRGLLFFVGVFLGANVECEFFYCLGFFVFSNREI